MKRLTIAVLLLVASVPAVRAEHWSPEKCGRKFVKTMIRNPEPVIVHFPVACRKLEIPQKVETRHIRGGYIEFWYAGRKIGTLLPPPAEVASVATTTTVPAPAAPAAPAPALAVVRGAPKSSELKSCTAQGCVDPEDGTMRRHEAGMLIVEVQPRAGTRPPR